MDLSREKEAYISDWIEFQTEEEVVAEFYETIQNKNFNIFWDIGAYRGLYTLIASEYIPHTYSFEPAPVPRSNLHETCEHFEISNYTSSSIPLYNSTEYQNLTVDTTSGSRTFIKGTSTLPERDTSNTVSRLVQRADRVIERQDKSPPDIVKVDVEGAEYQVLDGFGEYLSDVSVIFAEIHLSQERTDAVSDLLEENGFSVSTILTREYSEDDYQKFIKATK